MSVVLAVSLALSGLGSDLIVEGQSTWYGTGPGAGHAAAGRALRRAIGPGWRNRVVRVCRQGDCIRVRLTDWCACRPRTRVIDLSDEDFSRLEPLGKGVMHVHVRAS